MGCNTMYYSDGSGHADHAKVTGTNGYRAAFMDAGDCTAFTTDREVTEPPNMWTSVTISPP